MARGRRIMPAAACQLADEAADKYSSVMPAKNESAPLEGVNQD